MTNLNQEPLEIILNRTAKLFRRLIPNIHPDHGNDVDVPDKAFKATLTYVILFLSVLTQFPATRYIELQANCTR